MANYIDSFDEHSCWRGFVQKMGPLQLYVLLHDVFKIIHLAIRPFGFQDNFKVLQLRLKIVSRAHLNEYFETHAFQLPQNSRSKFMAPQVFLFH